MKFKKIVSLLLALMIAASAMTLVSCIGNTTEGGDTSSSVDEKVNAHITFIVTDNEGKDTVFEIDTDEKYLRGALEKEKLISGDESALGLMVTTVNGLKADYSEDGAYWSLYIGEDYAMTGVDSTPIKDGQTYKFVYTKA